MAIGVEELDRMRCANPRCHQGHPHKLFLNATCHTRGALYVAYEKGVLVLTCGRCNAPVCEVAVARARSVRKN